MRRKTFTYGVRIGRHSNHNHMRNAPVRPPWCTFLCHDTGGCRNALKHTIVDSLCFFGFFLKIIDQPNQRYYLLLLVLLLMLQFKSNFTKSYEACRTMF